MPIGPISGRLEAQPVHGPPVVVVEPADLALDPLRGERPVAGERHAGERPGTSERASLGRLMDAPAPDGRSGDPRGTRRPGGSRSRAGRGGWCRSGSRGGCRCRAAAPARACRHGGSRSPDRRSVRPSPLSGRARVNHISAPPGSGGDQRVGRRRRALACSPAHRRGVRRALGAAEAAEHHGAQEDARAHSGALPVPGSARATVSGVPSSVTASTSRTSGLCRR